MHKGRLEAFTDAIIAIIMTLMVLELKSPATSSWSSLYELYPQFAGYALSFTFMAIYWNNHHHMMQSVKVVDGRVLWSNNFLLFWLSAIPFVTEWVGKSCYAQAPVASYGAVLLLCGTAYYILTRALLRANGPHSAFARSLGSDFKGKASVVVYAIAIGLSWWEPRVSCGLYVLVALYWLVPDKRFERMVEKE
jgi:uncharacterized membrane protein